MVTTHGVGAMNASAVATTNSVTIPGGGDESKGFGRLAGDETVVPGGDDESDILPPTAEQLRMQRLVLSDRE